MTRPSGSDRGWLWVRSGILGGALAGLLDAGLAVEGGIGGLSFARQIRLVILATSLLAAVGGVVGALLAAGARIARSRRTPERWAAGLSALALSPLVIRDAVALFAGHQAAQVPGHRLVSVVVAALGTAAVYGFARRYARVLLAERPALLGRLALLAGAIACAVTNRAVLPRLYGWFHDTLSVATFVLCLLFARSAARSTRGWRVVVLAAIGAIGATSAVLALRASQVMRYAAYERTSITALALRAVPAALQAPPIAVADRRGTEGPLPPLPEGPRRPEADVLVITIDALRSDHVGAYGYPRGTTPHIDTIAAGGVRFARAYAQAPHTSFSIASMLTGKYFATLARLAPGEHHDPISAVLRKYGWQTAAFYPPAVFFIDAQKLQTYANTNFDFEYVKFEYLDAQRRVDQILAYYDEVRPRRSFVWVHFFEPHEPYVVHDEFRFGMGDVDRYDSEIAYVDSAVGRLVAAVRTRRPGTVVVIAADHGEEFDEHGGRYHGSTLFDEQLRIPLIVSIPGVAPHVVDGQVQLIDVTPTVLNLLDIPVPARMRGTDLGPWLATPPAPASRLPPAFAELEDKRMVVFGTDKLLCDLRAGFCARYDLAADPHEKQNLADTQPERAAALRRLLDDWIDGHVRLEPLLAKGGSNPEGGPAPRAIERGRLGDLRAAPELAALIAAPVPLSQRREAVELLIGLPPQPDTAAALTHAAADPDQLVADWAAVGAVRVGAQGARSRVRSIAADPATERNLRVRAALALATVGEGSGLAVLGDALDRLDDVPLRRVIVTTLGTLGDRRAVPIIVKHLPEVQNRREMVVALGDLADPASADALLDLLRADPYVPVRVEAARALAKLGDPRLAPRLERATRHETEATVVATTRRAVDALRASQN